MAEARFVAIIVGSRSDLEVVQKAFVEDVPGPFLHAMFDLPAAIRSVISHPGAAG